ncbi:MAG: imidazoleglycerol-phosphate dehydratase, partial [Ilumatobacteraceae bacterium]
MTAEARIAHVKRVTSESDVDVLLNLDGTGTSTISTGVGFYDHMLTALSRHSLIVMEITTTGDIYI